MNLNEILIFRFTHMFDVIERGTFWSSVLPVSGSGSIADVAATRDWATSLVFIINFNYTTDRQQHLFINTFIRFVV